MRTIKKTFILSTICAVTIGKDESGKPYLSEPKTVETFEPVKSDEIAATIFAEKQGISSAKNVVVQSVTAQAKTFAMPGKLFISHAVEVKGDENAPAI